MVAAVDKSRRISQIITAGCVVRNDEATGSIPVSSTNIAWRFLVAFSKCQPAAATSRSHSLREILSGKLRQKEVNYDS